MYNFLKTIKLILYILGLLLLQPHFYTLILIIYLNIIFPLSCKISSKKRNKALPHPTYSESVEKGTTNKYYERFMAGIRGFGYNDNVTNTAKEVIEYYKTAECDNLYCYKNYILYAVDYCNIRAEYLKSSKIQSIQAYKTAYDLLSNLNTELLMEKKLFYLDKGESVFVYWAFKMETLRGLGDKKAGEELLNEACQYWDKKFILNSINRFWKDVCYYHYYMLMEDKEMAKNTAARLSIGYLEDKYLTLASILNAEVMSKMGENEEALAIMKSVQYSYDNSPEHVRQRYQIYKAKIDPDSKNMLTNIQLGF